MVKLVLLLAAFLTACAGPQRRTSDISEADIDSELTWVPDQSHDGAIGGLLGMPLGLLLGGVIGFAVDAKLGGPIEDPGLDGGLAGAGIGFMVGPVIGALIGHHADENARRDEAIRRIRARQ